MGTGVWVRYGDMGTEDMGIVGNGTRGTVLGVWVRYGVYGYWGYGYWGKWALVVWVLGYRY